MSFSSHVKLVLCHPRFSDPNSVRNVMFNIIVVPMLSYVCFPFASVAIFHLRLEA